MQLRGIEQPQKLVYRLLLLLLGACVGMFGVSAHVFAAGEKKVAHISEIDGDETVYLDDFDVDRATLTINDTSNFYKTETATAVTVYSNFSGKKTLTNPWSVRYSNVGHTLDGRPIDIVFACTRFETVKDTYPKDQMAVRILKNNASWHPGMVAMQGGTNQATYRVNIYYAGTNIKVPDARYLLYFNDLDTSGDGGYSWSKYAEGVRLDSNYDTSHIYLSTSSLLTVGSDGGKPTYVGTKGTTGEDEEWQSGVAVIAQQDFTYTFRIWGNGAATVIGARSVRQSYASFDAPVKTAIPDTIASDGVVTFVIEAYFPYVYEGNQPKSITLTDDLADCLDASQAQVSVERSDYFGNTTDVTNSWVKSVAGQTLTLATTKTGPEESTLKHVFTITIPLKKLYNYNDGQLIFSDENLQFTNKANITVVPKTGSVQSKDSNTVTETVTGSVNPKILLQKGDVNLGVGKSQGDTTLAGAVYKVEYWNQWGTSGNPKATGTWTTNDKGEVDFTKSSWPYSSGNYSILPFGTYRVTETTAPAGYGEMSARTFEVRASNASGNMTITKGTGWDSGTTTAETGLVSIEPSITKGSINITVDDGENVTAQGDACIAGAQVEVKNGSTNPVVIGGVTYQPGAVIKTITVSEDGKASLGDLPYGSYTVSQKTPSTGYNKDTKSYTVQVHGTGAVDVTPLHELVFRGAMEAKKYDVDGKRGTPQGDASLAGAQFEIVNRSVHEVVVNGTVFTPGKVVTTVVVKDDATMATALKLLPYGTYELIEKVAPVGYEPTDETFMFEIRADGEVVKTIREISAE